MPYTLTLTTTPHILCPSPRTPYTLDPAPYTLNKLSYAAGEASSTSRHECNEDAQRPGQYDHAVRFALILPVPPALFSREVQTIALGAVATVAQVARCIVWGVLCVRCRECTG